MVEQDFFELNKMVKREIDQRLTTFFTEKAREAASIDGLTKQLIQDMERVVRRGGKRMRPTLVVAGYQAAGGTDTDQALDAALAFELLHAFTLMHDDVMDGDTYRHNALNITGIYERRLSKQSGAAQVRRSAEAMAILAGDLLFSFVFEIIAKLDVTPTVAKHMTLHINNTLFTTAAGQQLDVLYMLSPDTTLRRLLKVPHYKTAIYSFVSPLQFGALMAPHGAKLSPTFEAYGENLGVAFQLIDDVLGIFGTTKVTGKSNLSDIRDNKPTLLRYFGFRLASPTQQMQLKSIFGRADVTAADARLVKKILIDNGARSKTMVTAQEYGNKAQEALKEPVLPRQSATQLKQLADYCLERKL